MVLLTRGGVPGFTTLASRGRKRPPRPGSFARIAPLLALALAVPAAPATAQISVTQENDLTFGVVLAGTSFTLPHTDVAAAKFRIDAPRNTQVLVTITQPVTVQSGGNTVTVTFGSASGGWSRQDRTTGRTDFDPTQGTVLTVPPNGRIWVWVGGSVSPPFAQPAGSYSGTLTLTVTQL